MEKFLFRRIELWIVLLITVVGLLAVILFAGVVRNAALGKDRFGTLGKVSLAIAEIPSTAREMLKPDRAMVAYTGADFGDRSGWIYPTGPLKALGGYLLISRYDGNLSRHVVDLVDVSAGKIMHTWRPDADVLLKGTRRESDVIKYDRWNRKNFRFIHPMLMKDGGLLLKDHQSPLMRVNGCSDLVWRQENSSFHHATEPGADGTFWVPGRIEPSANSFAPKDFYDDEITQVSAAGDILFRKSIQELLSENGLKELLFAEGAYTRDPTHMNDVQPVPGDGPFWKDGDLFLSLRHLSMIVLYRPSTNKIIWKQAGPWAAQHDVDVINDHTIAVFNNNSYRYASEGRGKVSGANEIVFFDFASGDFFRPFRDQFEKNEIRTVSEGLFSILPGDYLFVEEENNGRALLFSPTGEVAAEFINRSENGTIYRLGWSRYVSAELGDAALASLNAADCNSAK